MRLAFSYLDKNEFPSFSHSMFEVLADNMSAISPTGNSLDEDYCHWFKAISAELKSNDRRIVLINDGEIFVGFFQYSIVNYTFIMEEIQFKCEYQGKCVFEKLYIFLVKNLPENLKHVEAYANKANTKSISILHHMGLFESKQTENGFKFKGDYNRLKTKYKNVGG